MNDDGEIPSVFNNSRTTDNAPLFTCGLKLDKYDYEKKVGNENIKRMILTFSVYISENRKSILEIPFEYLDAFGTNISAINR